MLLGDSFWSENCTHGSNQMWHLKPPTKRMKASHNSWNHHNSYFPTIRIKSSHNTIYPRKGTVFANFWQHLPTFDNNFCQLLTTFDHFWQLMATYGKFWWLVVAFGNFWQHTAMHQCSNFLHIAHSGTLPFSILDDFLEKFQKEGGGHFRSKNFSCRFKHIQKKAHHCFRK